MKSIIITSIALMLNISAFSQYEFSNNIFLQNEPDATPDQMVLKTNVLGLAAFAANLGYEYKTGEQTSVGIITGYKLEQTYTIEAFANTVSDGAQQYTGDITPKGYYINPYFRYYSNTALEGFYLEVFARYYSFEYQVPYDYEKNDMIIRANADGTADGMGGGLAIGSQMKVGPNSNVVIDIYAGGGAALGNAHVETNDPNLDQEDYADIAQKIEENKDTTIDILILGNIISSFEPGSDANSAWGDIEGEIFPILRAGICIGFIF